MKGTNKFKESIEAYLKNRAKTDLLFLKTFKKENKNIDDCVKYILNTVEKSGKNGFDDSEIFGMAVHYYDEDNIDLSGNANINHVVVNHQVQLTEQEIIEAKQEAREAVIQEERNKMLGKSKTVKDVSLPTSQTGTLF